MHLRTLVLALLWLGTLASTPPSASSSSSQPASRRRVVNPRTGKRRRLVPPKPAQPPASIDDDDDPPSPTKLSASDVPSIPPKPGSRGARDAAIEMLAAAACAEEAEAETAQAAAVAAAAEAEAEAEVATAEADAEADADETVALTIKLPSRPRKQHLVLEEEEEDEEKDDEEEEEEDEEKEQAPATRPPTAPQTAKQPPPWVQRHCALPGHEFYLPVPKAFIDDPVTAAILADAVPEAAAAEGGLERVLRTISGAVESRAGPGAGPERGGEHGALRLERRVFDVLHARYLCSGEGLQQLRARFEACVYGQCPRVFCRGHPLLPLGMHDVPSRSSVKVFCPLCRDAYHPQLLRHRTIDGAAFGSSAAHLLLQRHPDLAPRRGHDYFTARVYGYELDQACPTLVAWEGAQVPPPSR